MRMNSLSVSDSSLFRSAEKPSLVQLAGIGYIMIENRSVGVVVTSDYELRSRVGALGATVVERYDDITVMHDPEGNEFCVEPGPGDPRPASGR